MLLVVLRAAAWWPHGCGCPTAFPVVLRGFWRAFRAHASLEHGAVFAGAACGVSLDHDSTGPRALEDSCRSLREPSETSSPGCLICETLGAQVVVLVTACKLRG